MKTNLVLLVSAFLAATSASADIIEVGTPIYGGTGCPGGSASASTSPDGDAAVILFDNYVAEAGGDTGKRIDRKSCNIAIPLHVADGYSVALMPMAAHGFLALPSGGRATVNEEVFFAGSRGPVFRKTFTGPQNGDWELNPTLGSSAIVWTPCGADVNLRVNTSLTVQTNSRMEQALGTFEFGTHEEPGQVVQLQWRRCR